MGAGGECVGVTIIWVGHQQWGVWVEGIWALGQGPGGSCVEYRVGRVACGGHYCVRCVVRVLLEDGAG